MVKLTEVDAAVLVGENGECDSQYETDDAESVFSEVDDVDETLLQRIYALTDAFPVRSRLALYNSIHDGFEMTLGVGQMLGNVAWVLTTAAMVLVLPAALEIEKEHAGLLQDHQMRVQQQQTQQMMETSDGKA